MTGKADSRLTKIDDAVMEKVRNYRLIQMTGWTDEEIDEASAARCDWYLAIDSVFKEAQAQESPSDGSGQSGSPNLRTG